ncbi:hypothetical protein EJ02DRAFT_357787, partial [Clathrospora elynae]
PHPLLAQIPLTLSPFLSLPTPVPPPYSYKALPSTLPASILSAPTSTSPSSRQPGETQQPAYVVSATGTTASPDQILTSCHALQQHLQNLEASARRTLAAWEERRRVEDLAEKRRVAPGWLDSGVHILRPDDEAAGEKNGEGGKEDKEGPEEGLMDLDPQAERKAKEGEELDRVFGGLAV